VPVWLGLLLALLFVVLNGFFVAAEFAVVKCRATRMEELAESGSRSARLVLRILARLDEYLSACQLGITLSSIALGWIGEPVMATILEPLFEAFGVGDRYRAGISFGVGYTLISAAHIVVGEMAPKSLAIQLAERISLCVAYPLHWFYIAFKPAIWVLNETAWVLLRILGLKRTGEVEHTLTEAELQALLTRTGSGGGPSAIAADIARHSLEFATRTAGEVLIPRVDMVYLDVNEPLEEMLSRAESFPFSRYPLCDGGPDNVLGIVHVKDLFRLSRSGGDVRSIARSVPTVPESKPLPELLREFQRMRVHMAVVVDEYGGVEGIVTLEDVLEEIVGEIADEYDAAEAEIVRIGADTWVVSARTRLEEVNEQLGTDLESQTSETIGGWVFDALGRPPRPRDEVRHCDWQLVVDKMEGRRIRQVRVRRLRQSKETLHEQERTDRSG
jgi:CBS domain containing-hemolysin-like protein